MKLKAPRFFANNPGLKLLALVSAALAFYAIRGATGVERKVDAPVVVLAERGVAILEQDVRAVQVTLRGSADDIARIENEQVRAVIRPRSQIQEGVERVPIAGRNLEGVSGLRVMAIRPPFVTLTFDREVSKQLEVTRPRIIGKPLLGKVSLDYQPRAVTVRGPGRRLQEQQSVVTEPVDVEGRVQSFTKRVRVLPPDHTWVAGIEPEEITVRVNILTETQTRRIENTPILALTAASGDRPPPRFTPDTVTVVLQGRIELLDAVATNTPRVFVNCRDLNPGETYELPVEVFLPGAADIAASAEPATVKVLP